jgi:hypothetical protein
VTGRGSGFKVQEFKVVRVGCALLILAGWANIASAQVAVTGGVSAEARAFPERPAAVDQDLTAAQPTFTGEVKIEAARLPKGLAATFNPYLRYDTVDRGRTLFDLHELKISGGGQRWRFKVGYDVEFWGVMEFVNPVNVLNQSDVTDDFLGKRKLGTPMADVTLTGKLGTLDVYALTGFRPMRFPRQAGRLRPPLPIDDEGVGYVSGRGRTQLEGAVRYFRNIRHVYVGVSHFYGYSREPEVSLDFTAQGLPFLAATYGLEHQTGLELQVTFGNMILKSEDVVRSDARTGRRTAALSLGAEYDIGALLSSGRTVTLFGEYYHDTRPQSLIVPFRNDVFAGVRIGVNDRRSSEIRVWTNYDVSAGRPSVIMLDASARLSDRVKAAIAYRGIVSRQQALTSIAQDSHVVLKFETFF